MTRRQFVNCISVGAAALGNAMAGAPGEDARPTPFRLARAPDGAGRVPVMGISEWMCYYSNYDVPCPGVSAIEECIDLHVATGIDQIVWNCGRSVVDYWSDLPNATHMCELSDQIGAKSWAFVGTVMEEVCPLRHAIACCRDRHTPILGRLGMNRHYGGEQYAGVTSRFARDNPQFHERSKRGNRVPHRLCYAIDEVQRERIDILLEIQRIGVDALVLDFCRQMPVLMYHEALVEPYMQDRGVDPRKIDSDSPEDYQDWFQFRADVLTGFMRKLRQEMRRQEGELGKPCPVIARVPDNAPWLMIAYGLDVERWCSDNLIDGTMLSPFPRCVEDRSRYPEYHIALAHKAGKVCIGGVGSLNLIRNGVTENTGFFHRKPVYEFADRQYTAGADAMSLYQSETLVRMDYLRETLIEIGDRGRVADRAQEFPAPDIPADYPIGLDWHSRLKGGESLRVEVAGDEAL